MAIVKDKPIGKHRNTDETLRRRIGKRIEPCPTSGCWLWMLILDDEGYGRMWDGERNVPAHRASYEVFRGPISDDLPLDHLCRVRSCCNPFHLQPVTVKENTMRGFGPAAINARKTHCRKGHLFLGENLYIDEKGKRVCRTCARHNRAVRYARSGT